MASATVRWTSWNGDAVAARVRQEVAAALNETAADGVTIVQAIAPRDTGFMANTMEQLDHATPQSLRVSWGNITAAYTIWQEIGSQGRPGRYFLRRSLQEASKRLEARLNGVI